MTDLNYLNGRLRAMEGGFLGPGTFEAMLGLPDPDSLVSFLQDTPYGPSIEGVPGNRRPDERMEEGLRRNFSDTLIRFFRISKGEPERLVEIVISFWELCNLKTILRGLFAGTPSDRIMENLLPTAAYDEAALGEMCRQPDLSSVSNLLLAWRDPNGPVLTRALRTVREGRDLAPVEMELDRSYFERAFGRAHFIKDGGSSGGTLPVFLSAQVDRVNLLTALKVVEDKTPIAQDGFYFLEGGRRIRRELFSRLIRSVGISEALSVAAGIFPGTVFGETVESVPGISVLTRVERALDIWILKKIRGLVRIDPLGAGLFILVLLEKERELGNLRMILRGKMGFIPDSEIFRLLVLEA